jgi:AcrR family transcriptional regulator|nr:TetR/AcrR family transcriptional regulator [Candidatus Krumholzibacteria bacterium]
MTKGHETRNAILDQAIDLCSEVGLQGLTIGQLARRAGLSKSGLYAHFQSKENLQCAVLEAAADQFTHSILVPAFRQSRGLPRIEAMFHNWLEWGAVKLPGGCPFIAAASEFDDQPGPVRDALARHIGNMLAMVARAARFSMDEGHFRPDLDPEQYAFEYWGIILGHHNYFRLLQRDDAELRTRQAFQGLIARAQTTT